METKSLRYTLSNIHDILFQGFDYSLPEETLKCISEIAMHVGSPDYVRTPVFQKRDKIGKFDGAIENIVLKKRKNNKSMEILNDEEWNNIKEFQTTKIENKIGIDIQIDNIRTYLNKLTDKNYIDMRNKIIIVIDNIINESTMVDIERVSSIIFDIASTNRFYSKMYADLYSDLYTKYETMRSIFQINLDKFEKIFNTIEYFDPTLNYDKFCDNNKKNEKRKALCCFYLNLMLNDVISKERIILITRNLIYQIYTFISQDDKKNEVDELTENVSLLYKKELYENDIGDNYELIDGFTISEIIEKIAKSKVKDYKSLTNKTLFKFMDMIDM
jgi:hypothetical protein